MAKETIGVAHSRSDGSRNAGEADRRNCPPARGAELLHALDKEKLVRLMCLDTLGYSAKDIAVITPEQYEAEFGGDEDG